MHERQVSQHSLVGVFGVVALCFWLFGTSKSDVRRIVREVCAPDTSSVSERPDTTSFDLWEWMENLPKQDKPADAGEGASDA